MVKVEAKQRFRAAPVPMRMHRDMGVMTLIYHRRSGITHMVSEPVPQILAALDMLGPSDVAALSAHLSLQSELAADNAADIADALGARLAELAAVGLVSREAG